MNAITIRKCCFEDEEAARSLIIRILNDEFPKEIEKFPTEDLKDIGSSYGKLGEAFFVALRNGEVIGTVGIKQDDSRTALLRRLFVDSRFRGNKIGSRLVERAIEFCREVGYDELIFKTTSAMEGAIQLCQKRGFIPRARIDVGPVQLLKFSLVLRVDSAVLQNKKASA